MHCSCPCALPSRLQSVQYCTKSRSTAQIIGITILTIGYFNKNGERKDVRRKVVKYIQDKRMVVYRLLKAHHEGQSTQNFTKTTQNFTSLKGPTRRDGVEMASSLLNREMWQSCSNLD